MKCPDCAVEIADPPVWCKCGRDFRHDDPRSKTPVADRPLTRSERPRKVILSKRYTDFRWMDHDGFVRKQPRVLGGVLSLIVTSLRRSPYVLRPATDASVGRVFLF